MSRKGSILTIVIISVSSLFGAAVFPISDFGRTTLASISKQWLFELLVAWIVLIIWAFLYSRLLQKRLNISVNRSLYWAAFCHVPLLFSLSLIVTLYSNDLTNHLYLNSPHGQIIFQPAAKLLVVITPATMQLLLLAIFRWRHTIHAIPVISVFFLALILRFWNLNWGLPALYHWDEHHYLGRALVMMRTGDLNPHYFENPSLVIYVDYILNRILSPHIQSFHLIIDFFNLDVMDPRGDYLLDLAARSVSALAGTLTVMAIYWAGNTLFNHRIGLYSAALLAVCFLHVRNSHYATNDVLATFLLTLSFMFATWAYKTGRISSFLLSAFAGGLSTATKYNMGFFWVAVLISHLARAKDARLLLKPSYHLPLMLSGVFSLVGFLVGTPYALLDFPFFIYDFTEQLGYGKIVWHGQVDQPAILHYLGTLLHGLGFVPIALAVLGAILMLLYERRPFAIVLAIPAVYLLFMSNQQLYFSRFAIPLLPFAALLAGYALNHINLLPQRPIVAKPLTALVLIAALAQPSVLSWQHNSLLGQEDTRALASIWMESNLPPNATILAEIHSRLHSPFCWKGENMRDTSLFQPSKENPAELMDGTFDFIVVGSFGWGLHQEGVGDPARLPPIYEKLEREASLIAEFRPGKNSTDLPYAQDDIYSPFWHLFNRERPGPTIRIYQIEGTLTE